VMIGTLCSGAGGIGKVVASFRILAIWMYALLVLDP
jgi:hypothetical protein